MSTHSSTRNDPPVRVLFVCLGNICRSPTAHGVFETYVRKACLQDAIAVDSRGTGAWHQGEQPDERAQHHARLRGYDLSHIRARQISTADITRADLVLAMDHANVNALRQLATPADRDKPRLFLEFAPDQTLREVPDPYYGGEQGFETVLNVVEEASRGLLDHIRRTLP